MYRKSLVTLSASILFLSACGGGSSDPATPTTTPITGVFVDSPVSGLHYQTATQSGTTNSAGEYKYLQGETVTFSVGDISFGSVTASPVVTPLSLVSGATDSSNPEVTNIVRLLLTMDDDGNPDNGISIPAATATAAAALSVDFKATDLSTDTGIVTLLAAISGTPTLVDATTAQTHFSSTLASLSNWGSMNWGSGTWQAAAP